MLSDNNNCLFINEDVIKGRCTPVASVSNPNQGFYWSLTLHVSSNMPLYYLKMSKMRRIKDSRTNFLFELILDMYRKSRNDDLFITYFNFVIIIMNIIKMIYMIPRVDRGVICRYLATKIPMPI